MKPGKPRVTVLRALAPLAFAVALAAAEEIAAPTEVGGPILGYVYDGASAGIRRVIGIPGAALLTEPDALGMPLAGAVSVWPDYVLAVAGEDRQVRLLEIRSGAVRLRPIAGLAPGPDKLILSPGGREGIASPVGVSFSGDDRSALVANAGTDSLVVVDLESGQASRTPTRAKPTGLYALGGGTYAFRGPAHDEPLWLYAARGAKSRMFFAPPELKAPGAGAGSQP